MTDTEVNTGPPTDGWRFRIGIALFITGLLSPLFVSLVTAMNLSAEWKTTLSGLLLLGIPELLWLAAAAVMGGEFWDKLRALFVYGAGTTFPKSA